MRVKSCAKAVAFDHPYELQIASPAFWKNTDFFLGRVTEIRIFGLNADALYVFYIIE